MIYNWATVFVVDLRSEVFEVQGVKESIDCAYIKCCKIIMVHLSSSFVTYN